MKFVIGNKSKITNYSGEEIGLKILMKEADRKKTVSRETIVKKLKSQSSKQKQTP